MDEITLIKPTMEYAQDVMDFRRELLVANDADCFAGCSRLEKCESAEEWLQILDEMENRKSCQGAYKAHV